MALWPFGGVSRVCVISAKDTEVSLCNCKHKDALFVDCNVNSYGASHATCIFKLKTTWS